MSHLAALIAVVGGECSGKTSLCEALGQALPAINVPEYLRSWCERESRPPGREEQRTIILGQLRAERAARMQARSRGVHWVVSDGGALLTAAYSLEYFGDRSLLATGLRRARAARMVLLTSPEIDWRADGLLRDGPQRRRAVHERLVSLLAQAGIAYHLIAGNPDERLRAALSKLR